MSLEFSLLYSQHNRQSFDCGNPYLNRYIKEIANQDIKRKMCAIYVLADNNDIVGFYTISSFSLHIAQMPQELSKKYPQNLPLPCWLIERMAVDKKFQKQHFGKKLLMDALARLLELSEKAGGYCIIVDAKEKSLLPFYMKFGFNPLPNDHLRLYLPLSAIPAD